MRNLLPEKNRQLVTREYYMRLAVVSLLLLAVVSLIGIVTLLPAYFSARAKLASVQAEATFVEQSLSARDSTAVQAVRTINDELRAIRSVQDEPRIEELVRAVLSGKPTGISLSSVNFEKEGNGGNMLIRGVAVSRDALLSFRRALEAESRFSAVDLPISNLAQTEDIDFTLTLTLQEST